MAAIEPVIWIPVFVAQYAMELWQAPHGIKGFDPPSFVRIIKGPKYVGYTVQPKPPAALIDAGLIGVDHSRLSQLLFDYIFEGIQGFIRLLVEIEYRAFADRYMQLIGKIIDNPVIRYQLKLGQIHRMIDSE
jgi:hypothetical protein